MPDGQDAPPDLDAWAAKAAERAEKLRERAASGELPEHGPWVGPARDFGVFTVTKALWLAAHRERQAALFRRAAECARRCGQR
jgi:hypothetical protein